MPKAVKKIRLKHPINFYKLKGVVKVKITQNNLQLMDGGILANWNSANHPYCFLSNQRKVQILAFLHVIQQKNVSCPLPVRDTKG